MRVVVHYVHLSPVAQEEGHTLDVVGESCSMKRGPVFVQTQVTSSVTLVNITGTKPQVYLLPALTVSVVDYRCAQGVD